MARPLRSTLALSLAALASACGGGGGGGDAGAPPDTVAPTVAGFDPVHAATGVSRAAPIVVTFSEAIDPATVTSVTVALTGPSGAVPCARILSSGNRVVTLSPSVPPLANWAGHTVHVGTGVKDAAGNSLAAAASATFTTRDDVAPPAPSGLTAPAFANAADPAVTFGWTAPTDDGSGVASYDVEIATSGGGAFDPLVVTSAEAPLGDQSGRDGEWLRFRVRARDGAGNAGDFSDWSAFTIVDVTAPTATLDPADAATGVSRTADVEVAFSEPMDGASLGAAVTLTQGGTPILLTGTPSGSVLRLSHAELANHALHVLSVGTGATDVAGNPLALARTSTFRTADTVAPAAPAAPSAPALVNQASPTATFSWVAPPDDGAGVASYDWVVAVDTTGNPASIVRSGASATATSATVSSLGPEDGATLYARVRARDAYGNVSEDGPWSPGTRVDLTSPAAAIVPANGATDVARAGPFTVTFSEAIDAATVTSATVALETAGGAPVEHGQVLSGNVLTLTPSAALAHWGEYRIRATAAVRDGAANPLVAATSAFRAADDADPVLAAPVLDPGAFASTSVAFSWPEATDEGSGVSGYEVRVAVGAASYPAAADDVTAATGWTFDASGLLEGSDVRVEVRAIDVAGNVSVPQESDGVVIDRTPPSAPGVPRGPGAFALGSSVRFDWDPAVDGSGSGVVSYDVVAATTTLGTPDLLASGPAGATHAFVAAADGVTVYLQVRARDAMGWVGDASGWSEGVRMDALPPGAPGVPTHAAGAVLASPIRFDWTAASDASGIAYHVLQVTTGADGGGEPVFLGTTDGTGLSVSAADGTVLHARVRAVDRAGRAGPWSGSSVPVTADAAGPTAPGTPALAAVTDATLDVEWTAASDAASAVATYRVEVSPDPAFASSDLLGLEAGNVTSTTFSDVSRWDGRTVFARVRAVDTFAQDGAWSPVSAGVLVDATPPAEVEAPRDGGAYSGSATLHFSWTPFDDPTSGVARYTCRVAGPGKEAEVFATIETATPDCGVNVPAPLHGASIFVQVKAVDRAGNASGYGAWSDGIVVDLTVPGTPPAPVDAGDYTSATPLTFWLTPPSTGFDPGADTYVVHVGTTPGGSEVAAWEVPGVTPSVVVPAASGWTYYARVAGKDGITSATGAFSPASDGITVDTSAPGTPGVPQGGPVDDEDVTFTWSAAVDPESGVSAYEIAVHVDGSLATTALVAGTGYAFAPALHGQDVSAEVRAWNRAGLPGAWSARSAPVRVDTWAPFVTWFSPWAGGGTQPTSVDVVVEFSEDMDPASVASAVSISWGGTTPRHGYAFHWSGRRLTIVPDTQDPAGETNVDVLPERTEIVFTVAASATDLAGNGLPDPGFILTFTTGDETAPRLVSLVEEAHGTASPFAAEYVEGVVTLVATFDEDMSPAGASFALGDEGRIEARIGSSGVQGASPGGGGIVFALSDCSGIRVGDRVAVRDVQPVDLQVSHAEVVAVATGPCRVTVDAPWPGVAYQAGGWMTAPGSGGVRVQWTAPRRLEVQLPAGLLASRSEAEMELWNLEDLSRNSADVRRTIQVRPQADAIPPRLLASIPAAGAAGVRGGDPIFLRFSEAVRADTVEAITVDCLGCEGLYAASYRNDGFGSMAMLVPRASPPDGAVVTVQVPPAVVDLAGNPMAQPAAVTFTVGASGDAAPPQVRSTVPPDGLPTDRVWQIEVSFEDAATLVAERLDAASAGAGDVRVVAADTGLLVRGFRAEVERGTGTLTLRPPNGSPGLAAGWDGLEVGTVVAGFDPLLGGTIAAYTTLLPHGMAVAGSTVDVWIPAAPSLSARTRVLALPDPHTFVLAATSLPTTVGGGGSGIGWANVPRERRYHVTIAGPLAPLDGADGLEDSHGNAFAGTTFEVHVQPWPNRVPVIARPSEVRLWSSTSPAAVTIGARTRVEDPDGGDVTVSLWDAAAAATLSGTSRTLALGVPDDWGGGGSEYAYPDQDAGDGPPMATAPPELGGYASGYRPIDIVLQDGAASTRARRDLWIWAPADAPRAAGIDDGGTLRTAGARPAVVENGPDPRFGWTNLDAANADVASLMVLPLDGIDGGGGRAESMPFAPQAAGFARLAADLEPDVYLWTVLQQRLAPDGLRPASSGWSVDVGNFRAALFAYGPGNRSLAGTVWAGARAGVSAPRDAPAAWSALGTWTVEAPVDGSAPVLVAADLVDQRGNALGPTEELLAYAPGKRFTLTETRSPPSGPSLPVPMHGVVARGGAFFAAAQEDPGTPGIAAAARRDRTSGFGTSLDARLAYVQLSGWSDAGGAGVDGSVGYATFDVDNTVSVDGTTGDGAPFAISLPYALTDAGALTLAIGPSGETASGWIGGAAGEELAVLAQANAAGDQFFWLALMQPRAWEPTDGEEIVSGTYRFVELITIPGATAFDDAIGASGTMTFDGAGGFTYEGTAATTRFAGAGTYAVDPATRLVTVQVDDPQLGPVRYTTVLGQDVAFALQTDAAVPGMTELLILAR